MSLLKKIFSKKITKKETPDNILNTGGIRIIGQRRFSFNYQNYEDYYKAYVEIPQIRAVIDRSAAAFVRAKLQDVRIANDGAISVDDDSQLINAFRRPHPLLSEKEFWESFYKNWQIFGIAYVIKNIPIGFNPDEVQGLFVLPSKDVKIVPKKNIGKDLYYAKDISEIVAYYEIPFGNDIYRFAPDDIWTISDSSLKLENDGYLYPESKMKALENPIKIIAASYEIDLELKINHGAIGIISPDGKDGQGEVMPLTKPSRDKLQNDYQDYGLSKDKWKLIIADAALKFSPISLPVKELQLQEGIDDQKRIIADTFNYPYELLSNTKGTTFSNKKESREMLYTEKIIPEWDIVQGSLNYEFKINEQEGRALRFDYSHIEATQGDLEQKAATDSINMSTIIDLNVQVSTGVVTQDIAATILSYIFKIPLETAKGMLTDKMLEQNKNIGKNGKTHKGTKTIAAISS